MKLLLHLYMYFNQTVFINPDLKSFLTPLGGKIRGGTSICWLKVAIKCINCQWQPCFCPIITKQSIFVEDIHNIIPTKFVLNLYKRTFYGFFVGSNVKHVKWWWPSYSTHSSNSSAVSDQKKKTFFSHVNHVKC